MESLAVLLVLVLVPLCYCHNQYANLYGDEYDSDAIIDGILDSYRKDPGDESNSYKRTEEYVNDQPIKETISMPGVSPQKV